MNLNKYTEKAQESILAAQQLAERFAPIMMLKQQSEDCDPDGEPYRPGLVDVVLDNPAVALRQVGNADPVVKWAPSASDLFGLNQGFYIVGTALRHAKVQRRHVDVVIVERFL